MKLLLCALVFMTGFHASAASVGDTVYTEMPGLFSTLSGTDGPIKKCIIVGKSGSDYILKRTGLAGLLTGPFKCPGSLLYTTSQNQSAQKAAEEIADAGAQTTSKSSSSSALVTASQGQQGVD